MIISSLPMTDLHRHLDGNIRIQSILELGQKFSMALPATNIDELRPFVQVVEKQPDLMSFLQKLDWGVAVLGDLDACRRVAYENVEDIKLAGIDYAELRFSPYYMAMKHNLPVEGVVEAVVEGIQAGNRDFNLKTNLIGIMSRTFGVERCYQELEALLTQKEHLVAVDLAGDELGQPGSLFVKHFKKVRDAGLQVTVHAGEAAGAESIWQAINELGAVRIGHGVNAIQDPHLMEYLVKHEIGIESCITSNIQTSSITDIKEHPLKMFLEQGVKATINTDDPAVEGIELAHEYNMAAPSAGLSAKQIMQAQINGVDISFLSSSDKKLLRELALNR
ncbi:adenosine deaminase [Psychromonas sp. RZ22]|uniref:adenosine deaminase n=1 Tax=Psychromonas algarum TaxID=2555643 RepID=UPI00106776F9|nr:adenosine deaminase [Psychromonas sp. RZ22]TEW53703.1 adenosine deaminase [Psychromonas sp. RZ22]